MPDFLSMPAVLCIAGFFLRRDFPGLSQAHERHFGAMPTQG
jgi:hypothetical protein